MRNKRDKMLIIAKDKKVYNGFFVTGGQKYSIKLINEIKKTYPGELTFLDDLDFSAKGNKIKKFLAYYNNINMFKDYDLVYFNSTHYQVAMILKIIKKIFPYIRVVSEMHHLDYQTFKPLTIKHQIIKWLEKYILKNSDYIIIPNDYPADYVIKHKYAEPQKIIRINNAFERKAHSLANGKSNQLLFVGTVEPRKGIDYLIKSLQFVNHDFVLNIVGLVNKKSKYCEKLQKLIVNFGLEKQIHFLGRVSQSELNMYYESSRAFVFPSLNEGYGLAILEAMSFGLPVVAFNNTAMPYTIKNGYNGYLARNKDYKDFGKKIDMILSMSDSEFTNMSHNAVKTFINTKTEEDMHHQVEDFVQNIILK